MSRSGYTEDMDDYLAMGRWRAQVASATRGKRGQKFLSDLLAALDAMPEKALISGELVNEEGDVCAIGALGKVRGIDMQTIDPEDPPQVAQAFNIAEQLAQEVVYMNDEYFDYVDPEKRWTMMRAWVAGKISAAETQV